MADRADSHALSQVAWLLSRFAGAGTAGWTAPDEPELQAHVEAKFLAVGTAERLVRALAVRAAELQDELVVLDESPLQIRARVGAMQLEATAAEEPPHRLVLFRMFPVGGTVTDPRVAAPVTHKSGGVPAAVAEIADTAVAELGLPGLALAGGTAAAGPTWAVARGWARLDGAVELQPDHLFPAFSVTKLITATAVLRLVADGLVGLDDLANERLRTVRLADDTVTVRDLLAHTGGVDNPAPTFAATVPELAWLTGTVLACSGKRGAFRYSNGGYAALGQLIADVTSSPYPQAVSRLVLAPLAMTSSSFPAGYPADAAAVTGYQLTADGKFDPAPAKVCTMPAAGGLWTTASDLVRFGLGWSSLLPAELAREALRPQTAGSAGPARGLGWILNESRDVAGHSGSGLGGTASLIVRVNARRASAALASRQVPVEPVNSRVARALE